MFARERQESIVRLVNDEGRVAVAALAKRFDVTEDCIRKDLKTLAEKGLLRRVYGGAMTVDTKQERNIRKRVTKHATEKHEIARRAFDLIEDNEVIFLDTSTTNLALAQLIAESPRKITVVSNMIDILQVLGTNDGIMTVGTGGTINIDQNAFLGAFALNFLEPIRFDRAFIGALGVDTGSGEVLTFELEDGLVKQLAIKNSTRSYLMVDSHKFGAPGSFAFAKIEDFDAVVTNEAPTEVDRFLRQHQVDRV